jgi:hypothetical protein
MNEAIATAVAFFVADAAAEPIYNEAAAEKRPAARRAGTIRVNQTQIESQSVAPVAQLDRASAS